LDAGRADTRGYRLARRVDKRLVRLLAVLSDTHLPRGARGLPEECLDRVARADLVLHAGDVVRASVLEELRRLAPVHAVRGNVDEPELRAVLPERLVVRVGAVSIGMVHDAGRRDGRAARLVAAFPGCAAVVYGHSHLPELAQHAGVWILNPGSPTERRRAPYRSMISLEVDGDVVRPELVPLR
jgi:putative phosphoesterase